MPIVRLVLPCARCSSCDVEKEHVWPICRYNINTKFDRHISSMTQWKRAGLITLRSLDRNQLLLNDFFRIIVLLVTSTLRWILRCRLRQTCIRLEPVWTIYAFKIDAQVCDGTRSSP